MHIYELHGVQKQVLQTDHTHFRFSDKYGLHGPRAKYAGNFFEGQIVMFVISLVRRTSRRCVMVATEISRRCRVQQDRVHSLLR